LEVNLRLCNAFFGGRCDNRLVSNPDCKEDVEEVRSPFVALSTVTAAV